MQFTTMFWIILIGLSCFKCLLIPSYTSTDFEVHRNWLAITYNLPLSKWYAADHSEWTLDYPPFFAWFEYGLAQIAYYFDSDMLKLKNLNYKSENAILFQRLTVIIADLMFAYGVKECSNYLTSSHLRKSSKWRSQWNSPSAILIILLLGNATLLMVDHIHFQYNGFLSGILLVSIVRMLEDRKLEGAIWFAVLLNFKHIYVYIAPAYFVYLLRNYCFLGNTINRDNLQVGNSIKLGLSVLSIFLISLGPFIYCGQLIQLLTRLFPFKRGLCHAYWAPNFWAAYNAVDKIFVIYEKLSGSVTIESKGHMTSGLVQESEHIVLPNINPAFSFLLSFTAMLPCLHKLWTDTENPLHFVRSIVLCAFSSFLFGWHVHEKAILLVVIPLTIMSVIRKNEASVFLLLSTVSHYSMFPLLFKPFETLLKVLITLIHSIYAFCNLYQLYNVKHDKFLLPLLNRVETLYIVGLIPLFLFENIYPYCPFYKRWPFVPLMFVSIYNSIGVIYSYISYYIYFLSMTDFNHKRKTF